MPGGPAFFVQKRVGKDGKLFDCHKFRTMRGQSHTDSTDNTEKQAGANKNNDWSTVSVAGDDRITPLGATLRHYKQVSQKTQNLMHKMRTNVKERLHRGNLLYFNPFIFPDGGKSIYLGHESRFTKKGGNFGICLDDTEIITIFATEIESSELWVT